MRLAPAASAFALLITSFGTASAGLPTDRFALAWESASPFAFVPGTLGRYQDLTGQAVPLDTAAEDDASVALASADEVRQRRELELDAMATSWSQERRTALEVLRSARRAYASAGPATASGANDDRFIAMLHEIVDGTGRSAANADDGQAEATLSNAYAAAMRRASDRSLQEIEGTEKAWTAYRDAFGTFAQAMDASDAGTRVQAEMARRRAGELDRVGVEQDAAEPN